MLGEKKRKKPNSEKEEKKTDKTPRSQEIVKKKKNKKQFKDNLAVGLHREVSGASLKREAPDLKCPQVLLGSATGEHLQQITFGHYL